jgi:superfamily II DNA/RNA helicase
MMRTSCGLRNFARKGAPVLVMSATATEPEAKQVVKCLGLDRLRKKPLLIAASPVQANFKFCVIRRPSNAFMFAGTVDKAGEVKPGMWHLLQEIYLREWLRDLKAGRQPKRCIIFCRGMSQMAALHSHLATVTGYRSAHNSPFVMVHGDVQAATEQVISQRLDHISLFIATTKMLMGLDLSRIDMVIFLQPFNQVAGLLQGAGRGGRKQRNGLRRAVLVYQLWNASDLTKRNAKMSNLMRTLCRTGTTACTKLLLENHFKIGKQTEPSGLQGGDFCCMYHDLKAISEQE